MLFFEYSNSDFQKKKKKQKRKNTDKHTVLVLTGCLFFENMSISHPSLFNDRDFGWHLLLNHC